MAVEETARLDYRAASSVVRNALESVPLEIGDPALRLETSSAVSV